jgi:hypothetical protein
MQSQNRNRHPAQTQRIKYGQPNLAPLNGALPDDFWPVLVKLPYDFSSDDIPAIRKTPEYKVLYNKWQAELAQNQVPAEHVASASDSVAIEPLRLDYLQGLKH